MFEFNELPTLIAYTQHGNIVHVLSIVVRCLLSIICSLLNVCLQTSVIVAHEEGQKDQLSEFENSLPRAQGNENTLDYMPVKKIISEKERMKLKEAEQSVYNAKEHVKLDVPKIPLRIPYDLAAFAYHVGDVSTFPPAKRDKSDKLGTQFLFS